MKFRIYLCGLMTANEATRKWREDLQLHYQNKGWEKVVWLNPFNSIQADKISEDGLSAQDIPANAIVHRDLQALKSSQLVVAHMSQFGEKRNLTGSLIEIGWLSLLNIPLIMITDEAKYINHPFLQQYASAIAKDVDEVIEKKYIDFFYKGMVNSRIK